MPFSRLIIVSSAFTVFAASGSPVLFEDAKLLPDDGAAYDQCGFSVAYDAETAIVGAVSDDDNGENSGSAYVFVRDGDGWVQQAKLLPEDGEANDSFGSSIALYGNTALIGADGDDDGGSRAGAVYVYERHAGVWTQQTKLTVEDSGDVRYFGSASAVDGDTAVIGAFGYDESGEPIGCQVYVFVHEGAAWTQQAKLVPSDGIGLSAVLSVDGDTVIVGASDDDTNGNQSGSAYIFIREAGAWTQQAKLFAGDGQAGDLFGGSVSIDGDTAIVSAPFNEDLGSLAGSAYVFVRESGGWSQQAKILPDDGGPFSLFGIAVDLTDDRVVVSGGGFSTTLAYLFERDGNTWLEQAKLVASDANQIANAISLGTDTVIIGTEQDGQNGIAAGAAYAFDLAAPPAPCNPADVSEPWGVLDGADVTGFVNLFRGGSDSADLSEPLGVLDLGDVVAFVEAFMAGCP